MSLAELTEYIIKNIIDDPSTVSTKEFTNADDSIQIEVLVAKADMPKVIGHNGKVINSIRTLVQASSSIHEGRKVNINVESY